MAYWSKGSILHTRVAFCVEALDELKLQSSIFGSNSHIVSAPACNVLVFLARIQKVGKYLSGQVVVPEFFFFALRVVGASSDSLLGNASCFPFPL
ncbi:hypothetical protein SADUNF_Sadunf01G0169700 [Salix dunnii]|uniref:Uncharacterized protein n=1 Tax=Salix dunnii TaxID=1413687 RepID=A0A835NC56_9ROSI|nr:hypothetical protein SADUNF_Sadunf01G0169700 [Salix dunnii]